jgi:hypothetical protein
MFDFEAKADSPNRHRLTRYRYLCNFQKPNVIQYNERVFAAALYSIKNRGLRPKTET